MEIFCSPFINAYDPLLIVGFITFVTILAIFIRTLINHALLGFNKTLFIYICLIGNMGCYIVDVLMAARTECINEKTGRKDEENEFSRKITFMLVFHTTNAAIILFVWKICDLLKQMKSWANFSQCLIKISIFLYCDLLIAEPIIHFRPSTDKTPTALFLLYGISGVLISTVALSAFTAMFLEFRHRHEHPSVFTFIKRNIFLVCFIISQVIGQACYSSYYFLKVMTGSKNGYFTSYNNFGVIFYLYLHALFSHCLPALFVAIMALLTTKHEDSIEVEEEVNTSETQIITEQSDTN